jgi:hypothetical protein
VAKNPSKMQAEVEVERRSDSRHLNLSLGLNRLCVAGLFQHPATASRERLMTTAPQQPWHGHGFRRVRDNA